MSAYGPALFVSRKDKNEISESEQKEILKLVKAAAKKLDLRDDDDSRVSPETYDYGEYEENALSVLLFSSHAYGEMPEEVQADEDEAWKEMGARLGEEIEKQAPGTYVFTCYAVED
jgi:hypothetical protein